MPSYSILVVDDDASFGSAIRRLAERLGHTVTITFDGASGVAEARRVLPDVILMDVMMPHLDGRDALAQLRKDEATRDIPVIICSARGSHSDRLVGLELGADDYIVKPFDVDMLLRRIEHLAEKRKRR